MHQCTAVLSKVGNVDDIDDLDLICTCQQFLLSHCAPAVFKLSPEALANALCLVAYMCNCAAEIHNCIVH